MIVELISLHVWDIAEKVDSESGVEGESYKDEARVGVKAGLRASKGVNSHSPAPCEV